MPASTQATMMKTPHFYAFTALMVLAGILMIAVLALVGTDSTGCPKAGDPISRPGHASCYYQTPVG